MTSKPLHTMKHKLFIVLAIAFAGVFYSQSAAAQCDSIATICSKNMSQGFISDGQSYRALLVDDQVAEFRATLYGGSTYRMAACSGFTDGNLALRIFDEERNLLYDNSEYKNAPYWDFEIKNTINCTIEAQLNPSTNMTSGCAVLLMGFK